MADALGRLRAFARRLKADVLAVYFAARDPAAPWAPRLLALLIAAYALSPIDLIPDFIPVLGLLDELVLLPLGLWLVLRLMPPAVMARARERAARHMARPRSWAAALFILALWLAMALLGIAWWRSR